MPLGSLSCVGLQKVEYAIGAQCGHKCLHSAHRLHVWPRGQIFWMVVILGYRRQRIVSGVLLFLCLSCLFIRGSLLALNSQIHYLQPPGGTQSVASVIISAGSLKLPALIVHCIWNMQSEGRCSTISGGRGRCCSFLCCNLFTWPTIGFPFLLQE